MEFQWWFGTASLAGQTNDTLILSNVQPPNAGDYSVALTNAEGGVTSGVAMLTVWVPPSITRQPTNQSASIGASVSFSVQFAGTSPRFQQWRFNGNDLPGKTSTSLVLTNLQLTNTGDYTVVVTNIAGAITSQVARLIVDSTFTKMTAGHIVNDNSPSIGCAWGDYDNDGLLDLFVTNGGGRRNWLYRNNGDGSFTRVTTGTIVTDFGDWRGCAWADYDNDGKLDLLVTSTDTNGYSAGNVLYRNNGDGSFARMTTNTVGRIAASGGGSEGCIWGDYDNDGFLDLFLTARLGRPNILYRNNGDATFTRIPTGSPPNDSGDCVGCTWGDYNNDGFLDLFVANGAFQGRNNLLYRNNGNSNRWLKVKCVGTVSNRSAIGTKVRVKTMIGGETRWQLRQISNGCGFAGGEPLAHFGLGEAPEVDSLRIEWPSGTVQEFRNVAANQFLTVTEPPHLGATSANGSFQLVLDSGVGFNCRIEASTNLLDWAIWLDLTATNRTMIITESANPQLPQRFYRAAILPTP